MKIVTSIEEFRAKAPIGSAFVPTLGALHEGHLSLFRAAYATGLPVVASIFVNPLQFGANEDFTKYPRNIERDSSLAEGAGVKWIFAPSRDEMFPGATTTVSVPEVTELWEGERRPTHFEGVATVVCKLFHIVRPEVAIFGNKDLQQCSMLQRMVDDLQIPVTLRIMPTVREPDGLAMSSRNVYLSPEDRALAPSLYEQLVESRRGILAGEKVRSSLDMARSSLAEKGFRVDYYDLIDKKTFKPTESVDSNGAIIAAVHVGMTRLIDNVQLFESDDSG